MTRDELVLMLQSRRARAGSVAQLARDLEVNLNSLSGFLNGTRGPTKELLGRLGLREVVSYEAMETMRELGHD